MQPGVIIAILAILVPLWILLRKDFVKGLAFAVFFWVSMTTLLRIQLPGSIPALTIHRLMLIVVAIAWLTRHRLAEARSVPLFGCFVFWFLANLVSLLGTQITFIDSLKTFLDFVLEVFVFYVVASTTVKTRERAARLLYGAWLGLLVVAFFAAVEKQTGFNPVDRFIPGYVRDDGEFRMILSTYQHRILLGTAMAMGVPLSFVLRHEFEKAGRPFKLFWPGLALLLVASYYGQSRGPWLGLALAMAIMFALGASSLRKNIALIGALAVLALVARPGVLGTLTHFAEDTVDTDSFKGGTAQYRMELWRVAFYQVSKSVWTFFFGYGPSAGKEIQFEWELSYRGTLYLIDSWDNHFAYSLFQFGFVGLAATLLLYLKGTAIFFRTWRQSPVEEKNVFACLLATAVILIWMMTNVLIFAKQIDYLFWTVIAAGMAVAGVRESSSIQVGAETDPGLVLGRPVVDRIP